MLVDSSPTAMCDEGDSHRRQVQTNCWMSVSTLAGGSPRNDDLTGYVMTRSGIPARNGHLARRRAV